LSRPTLRPTQPV